MEAKERQVSDRSLENLKLGAKARYQGKVRHNFTILPETSDWLKSSGNASSMIDDLVEFAKNKALVLTEIEELRSKVAQLERERDDLKRQCNAAAKLVKQLQTLFASDTKAK